MRKLYDKLIGVVGVDRVAHFCLFGLVVALAAYFEWLPMLIAFVLMAFAAYVKEWGLSLPKLALSVDADTTPDKWDFVAGVTGGVLAVALWAISAI